MTPYVWKRRADGVHIINIARPYGQRAVLKYASYTGAQPIAGRDPEEAEKDAEAIPEKPSFNTFEPSTSNWDNEPSSEWDASVTNPAPGSVNPAVAAIATNSTSWDTPVEEPSSSWDSGDAPNTWEGETTTKPSGGGGWGDETTTKTTTTITTSTWDTNPSSSGGGWNETPVAPQTGGTAGTAGSWQDETPVAPQTTETTTTGSWDETPVAPQSTFGGEDFTTSTTGSGNWADEPADNTNSGWN
ncbi:unnamed protein product [Rhizophagus irregularis]|nr:unnamed protein product [Rhizophagus irregularis]